jgi:hypothetical protein
MIYEKLSVNDEDVDEVLATVKERTESGGDDEKI